MKIYSAMHKDQAMQIYKSPVIIIANLVHTSMKDGEMFNYYSLQQMLPFILNLGYNLFLQCWSCLNLCVVFVFGLY